MRERPILFSGPMVRAILAGTKTQTRRPVKPQPTFVDGPHEQTMRPGVFCWHAPDDGRMLPYQERACPFGQPGDRLWVRETFSPFPPHEVGSKLWGIVYGADAEQVEREAPDTYRPMLYNYERWSPSIHMPRWACRLVLEIVNRVYVERLEDITEEGARAEGFESRASFLAAFRAMYKLPPDANPWVWVVEFKRVEASA